MTRGFLRNKIREHGIRITQSVSMEGEKDEDEDEASLLRPGAVSVPRGTTDCHLGATGDKVPRGTTDCHLGATWATSGDLGSRPGHVGTMPRGDNCHVGTTATWGHVGTDGAATLSREPAWGWEPTWEQLTAGHWATEGVRTRREH